MYKYELVCAGIYEYVIVRTSTYWNVQVHTSMYYTYIRVCTGLYQYMLVCTSTYQHVLHIFPPVGIFGYKLVHARLSLLVLSHTALYPLVLFWIRGGTRRYQAVKFGTMRYKAVPESPVPLDSEVQAST